VVSNPPFISVPAGVDFALAGAGGEDGLDVLRPLLAGLPARLSAEGSALIYAEGIGDASGPYVRDFVGAVLVSQGLSARLVLTSRLSVGNALVLRAIQLQKLHRDVPRELAAWKDMYERQGATHLFNYVLRIGHSTPGLLVIPAYDPSREPRV
jgi:hypothetical protein